MKDRDREEDRERERDRDRGDRERDRENGANGEDRKSEPPAAGNGIEQPLTETVESPPPVAHDDLDTAE